MPLQLAKVKMRISKTSNSLHSDGFNTAAEPRNPKSPEMDVTEHQRRLLWTQNDMSPHKGAHKKKPRVSRNSQSRSPTAGSVDFWLDGGP